MPTSAPSRRPPRLPLEDSQTSGAKSRNLAEAVAREESQQDARKSSFRPPSTWSTTTAEVLWTGDQVVPPMPLTPASATFSLAGGGHTNGSSSVDGEEDDFADAPSWDGNTLDPKAGFQTEESADSDAWRMSQFGADQSTFGHARNSSVGSSVWAGKGAVNAEEAPPMPNLANNSQYVMHAASSGLAGPASANGAFTSLDRRKSFESSSDYSATDDVPLASRQRTGFQRDWKMPSTAPSPPSSASAEAAALEADEALDGFDIVAPASGVPSSLEGSTEALGAVPKPKMPPIPAVKAKNTKRKQQGRKNRSPVLSYADGEEAEEGILAKQIDGEGLQRMASLGPKLKKNSPAPWELDDTAPLPPSEASIETRPSSDRMHSTYARLRGVASGRPSGDSSSNSRGRDPAPIASPTARMSSHRGSTPSLIDADRSVSSATPTTEGSALSSIFTSARSRSKSVSSAAGGMFKGLGLGGSNSGTPGANSPLVQVPPPLPIASSASSIHDKSISRKSKFVKAFRKATGEDDKKAPLSLAAGISSEDYRDVAPEADANDAQAAHSQAIQSQLDQQAVAQQAMKNSLQQHAASLGAPSPSVAGSQAVSPYATPAGDRSPIGPEPSGLSAASVLGTSPGGEGGTYSGFSSPLPPASPTTGPSSGAQPVPSSPALLPPQRPGPQRRVSDTVMSSSSSQPAASPVMQPSSGPHVPRTLSLNSSASSSAPAPTSLPSRATALTPPPNGRTAEPIGRVVSGGSTQSGMSRLSYKRSSSFIEPGMVPSRQQTMSPPTSAGINNTSMSQQQQQSQPSQTQTQAQPSQAKESAPSHLRDTVTSPNRRNLILRSDESALDGNLPPGVPPGVQKVTNSAYYSSDGFGGYVRQRKNSSGQTVTSPVALADVPPPVPSLPSAQPINVPTSPVPSSPPSSHAAPVPTPMNMPRPGAHEAAGYKLISLEQARLNQQRAQAAERAAGRPGTSDSATAGMAGAGHAGAESGGHRAYPSESGSMGGINGRPTMKNKKSGFMRIFNNKEKGEGRVEGSEGGDYGKASEESDSVGMMPSFNAGRGMTSTELDAPALSLRPMSSMFAGLGTDLLDASALAGDEANTGANGISGATSPGSPSGLAPPTTNGFLAPSASVSSFRSNDASSRSSSGIYEDTGSVSPYASPGNGTPARGVAASLSNGDLAGEGRTRRKTASSSAGPSSAGARPSSIAESTHSDASSLGGAANGFPTTPLGAPQTPGPAWRARAIELETRISEMAAELTRIRVAHLAGNDELPPPEEPAQLPLPQSLDEQMKQSVTSILGASASATETGAQTPAMNASSASASGSVSAPSLNEPQTPLSEMGAIPPCAFCGCGCAELKRAKAVNEMAVLKGLSVLARGRPLQPGNGAGSRFGSHTNRT